MQKVLMITSVFPPLGESGVHRTIRFVKYLPEYSWVPVILTIKEDCYEPCHQMDFTLMKKIPQEIKVYKTNVLRPMYELIKFRNKIKQTGNDTNKKRIKEESLFKKKWQYIKDIISDLFTLPDSQIGWLPFAVLKGMKLVKEENIDVIYTVGPPHSTHLNGILLKKITRKPWVADFRDPWTHNPWERKYYLLGRKKIEEIMEYNVLKFANRVIANTDALREHFINWSHLSPDKFVSITNGFDPEDFERIDFSPKKDMKPFTITHTGSFYIKRNPITFLEAIAMFITKRKIPKGEIKVNLIGPIDIKEFLFEEFLEKLGITEVVNFTKGSVSHEESLKYLINSDLLLLVQQSTSIQIPAKIFEYIKVGKPILALTIPGATAELIRTQKIGIVVDPDDTESIEKEIYNFYIKFKEGKLYLNPDSNIQKKYDGIELTKKLTMVFEEVYGIKHISF